MQAARREADNPCFLRASLALVQVYAVAALVLGPPHQLALPKGAGFHRILGYAGVALMAPVATSAFGVAGEGRYSYIHLIAAATLACLPLAVWRARRHRTLGARMVVLVITGAFTLLPGRLMHAVVFGP